MSSLFELFSCCQRINYLKNKEIDINSNNNKKEEEYGDNELKKNNNNIKNMNNNSNSLGMQNLLLNQSNSELYNNFLKNNISVEKQNISFNNANHINLDKTQKILNIHENFDNFSNKVINNNIINNNIIKITNNNNFLNMNQKDLGYVSFCAQSNLNKSNISEVKPSKPKNLILSGNLFFNKNIKISQNGLENSLRKKSEFPIYFGTESLVDKNGVAYNDFIVNYSPKKKVGKPLSNESKNENNDNEIKENDNQNQNLKSGRLFQILYDKNKNEYILNFIHNSLILYYRINKPIYFEYDKEYYFILGNVFLSILIKKIQGKNNICVRVETEDQKAEKANFEDEKKLVIGRSESCDIEIDKQCISKIHSVIEYDNHANQYYYKDNNSTNGSTLLIREDDSISIKDCMYFKLEDISFVIKETE